MEHMNLDWQSIQEKDDSEFKLSPLPEVRGLRRANNPVCKNATVTEALATTNQDIYLEGRASISETHGAVQ
jgi:hypothetical protein